MRRVRVGVALLWLAVAGEAICQQPPAAPAGPVAQAPPPAVTTDAMPQAAASVPAGAVPSDAQPAAAQATTGTQPTTPSAPGDDTSTLDTVQVTAKRAPIDLDKLRNRSEDPRTIFSRDWKDPFSLEDFGMRGGLLGMGARYVQESVRDGARKLPGWKRSQPATARPPPDLDDDQLRRAAQFEPADAGAGVDTQPR